MVSDATNISNQSAPTTWRLSRKVLPPLTLVACFNLVAGRCDVLVQNACLLQFQAVPQASLYLLLRQSIDLLDDRNEGRSLQPMRRSVRLIDVALTLTSW